MLTNASNYNLILHIFIGRKENREYMDVILSEESKTKRFRRKAVSIQTTFVSWILEAISGVCVLLWYTGGFSIVSNSNTVQYLAGLDCILCFIVIPSTYVANTDAAKKYFLSSGVCISILDAFRFNQPNQAGNEVIEMNPFPNVDENHDVAPQPIATISGRIAGVSNRDGHNIIDECERL